MRHEVQGPSVQGDALYRIIARENRAEEFAMAAVTERKKHRGQPAQGFYDGYVLGFQRTVSLMQQQALAFGLDLKELKLDGIEPDRDLV